MLAMGQRVAWVHVTDHQRPFRSQRKRKNRVDEEGKRQSLILSLLILWVPCDITDHTPPPTRKTCKTQKPATLALHAPEIAFRPHAPKLNPRPEVHPFSTSAWTLQGLEPEPSAAPRPRMRCRSKRGVGATGTKRAQYRLVHGAALRCSAGTCSRWRPEGAWPAQSLSFACTAPRRPLQPHVDLSGWLFAAHAVALATSNAPPGSRGLLQLPTLEHLLWSRARWTQWHRSPLEAGSRRAQLSASQPRCHFFTGFHQVSVRSQQKATSSISQVHPIGICLNVEFYAFLA